MLFLIMPERVLQMNLKILYYTIYYKKLLNIFSLKSSWNLLKVSNYFIFKLKIDLSLNVVSKSSAN